MTECCPTCGDEFEATGALRDHAWDAHGSCHYCGEQFDNDEETLYVHWLTTHGSELSRTDRKRAENAVGPISFGDRLAHKGVSAAFGSLGLRGAVFAGVGVFAVVFLLVFGGLSGGGLLGDSGSASGAYNKTSAPNGLNVGETPPDFTLQTTSGEQVTLHDGDRPTVVFFMASWCTTCRFESENLQEIRAKYGNSVRIISVDVDPSRDSMDDLRQFQSQYGGEWIHAMGTSELVQDYRVQSLDTTYILNEHGVTVYRDTDVTDASTLDRQLSRLTNEEAGGMSDADYGDLGSAHWHADFSVAINDDRVDFSKDRYMVQSEYVHLEGGDGTTIHKHATGVTLADFFNSIGWQLTDGCLRTDTGEEYCSGDSGELRIIVNGEDINNPDEYEIQDDDTIRVIYE